MENEDKIANHMSHGNSIPSQKPPDILDVIDNFMRIVVTRRGVSNSEIQFNSRSQNGLYLQFKNHIQHAL